MMKNSLIFKIFGSHYTIVNLKVKTNNMINILSPPVHFSMCVWCACVWAYMNSYTCMRRPQVDVQYSFPLLSQLSYWHRVSLSNSERACLSGQLVCGSSVLFKAEITGRLPPCSLYLTWIPGSKFWSCKHFNLQVIFPDRITILIKSQLIIEAQIILSSCYWLLKTIGNFPVFESKG